MRNRIGSSHLGFSLRGRPTIPRGRGLNVSTIMLLIAAIALGLFASIVTMKCMRLAIAATVYRHTARTHTIEAEHYLDHSRVSLEASEDRSRRRAVGDSNIVKYYRDLASAERRLAIHHQGLAEKYRACGPFPLARAASGPANAPIASFAAGASQDS